MSVKRQATNQLTQENWDQEDPSEQEDDTGGFKIASKDVLEKRVIRVAKRRTQTGEAKKSVFSGFTGFNKTQPASFDFLAKLTNGNNTNNVTTAKNENVLLSNTLTTTATSSPSIGVGVISGTSTPLAKTTFGKSATETPIFGTTTTSTGFTQSVFSASKTSTTVNENPFKIQPIQSPTQNADSTSKLNTSIEKVTPQVPSNIFGSSLAASSSTKSLFSMSGNNSSPFKAQTLSTFQTSDVNKSPNTSNTNNLSPFNKQTVAQPSEPTKPTNKPDIQDEKKLVYYNKLKGLNESVSSWIKKHVEETPLCILTPIFKDYEKYLKEIQEEYEKSKEKSTMETTSDTKQNKAEIKSTSSSWPTNTGSSLFSTSSNVFSNNKNSSITSPEKSSNFGMGTNTPSNTSTPNFSTSPSNTGFSFGIKPSSGSPSFGEKSSSAIPSQSEKTSIANTLFGAKPSSTTSSPFALNVATTNSNSSTPFSFGIGKPFSFNSNVQKTEEPAKEEENEDEPPKVEYTPIVEENSVFDKKCKVFVKKDSNFIDKGVGTLYIKKIENSEKHQLLVRANTSLGNVLLNLILSSSVPIQRMGKNNVMMVCIPTPEAKPPPTSILIRVKTPEEADELLETLNKYKA